MIRERREEPSDYMGRHCSDALIVDMRIQSSASFLSPPDSICYGEIVSPFPCICV
jgi:hypothetical protein